ncbi:Protein of unknown function [Gryllus bimaculatus]|nr:Protein of unknown function [Gryllus bimaculatus]
MTLLEKGPASGAASPVLSETHAVLIYCDGEARVADGPRAVLAVRTRQCEGGCGARVSGEDGVRGART